MTNWKFYTGEGRPPYAGAAAIVDHDGALMCIVHGATQKDAVDRGNAIIAAMAGPPAKRAPLTRAPAPQSEGLKPDLQQRHDQALDRLERIALADGVMTASIVLDRTELFRFIGRCRAAG